MAKQRTPLPTPNQPPEPLIIELGGAGNPYSAKLVGTIAHERLANDLVRNQFWAYLIPWACRVFIVVFLVLTVLVATYLGIAPPGWMSALLASALGGLVTHYGSRLKVPSQNAQSPPTKPF